MKRIACSCLLQTLNFILDPSLSKEEALERVNSEVKNYKQAFSDNIKIVSETTNSDGSVTLSIKKKVSGYDIGHYFED